MSALSNAGVLAASQKPAHACVVVLLGPPGSGKGTQARRLANTLGLPAISTGDLLREQIRAKTKLGRKIADVVNGGGLVCDQLINAAIEARLALGDCARGCILDGYPRNLDQARFLDALLPRLGLPRPVALRLTVPVAVICDRLAQRYYCPSCGRTYDAQSVRPARAGFCDADGEALCRRADDCAATVQERYRLYLATVQPLAVYYAARDYCSVCADASVEVVFDRVLAALTPFTAVPGQVSHEVAPVGAFGVPMPRRPIENSLREPKQIDS